MALKDSSCSAPKFNLVLTSRTACSGLVTEKPSGAFISNNGIADQDSQQSDDRRQDYIHVQTAQLVAVCSSMTRVQLCSMFQHINAGFVIANLRTRPTQPCSQLVEVISLQHLLFLLRWLRLLVFSLIFPLLATLLWFVVVVIVSILIETVLNIFASLALRDEP